MKKQLFLLLTILTCLSSFAQIDLEKGYFINNSNQKTECLIKNIDWLDNPVDFKYKLAENSEYLTADIKFVKEFGIYNESKYIRNKVLIDRSANDVSNLSRMSAPSFNEEELFLKVLVEGKANLYEYTDGDLTRYFYNIENSTIEQLVYKKYITKTDFRINDYKDAVSENNYFKQQLWNNLKCQNFTTNKLKNINYKKKDLVNFFIEYSDCNSNNVMSFKKEEAKKDNFNLTLRPRLSNSSLSVEKNNDSSKNTDFGNKLGFGFGIEVEYILPFNRDKWSLLVEPTYQYYKSEKSSFVNYPYDGTLTRTVDYKSIEIPIGFRHYFFLNKKSKLFTNALIVLNVDLNSSVKYSINNLSITSMDVKMNNNFAMGIGYNFDKKYSLEIRYQTSREILSNYTAWSSDHKTLSMIFGYTIF